MTKKIYILTTLFLFCFQISNSELIRSKFKDYIFAKNGDTIVINRSPGNWWYGPIVGATQSFYFGEYLFPEEIIPGIEYTSFLKYKNGSYFPGFFTGLLTEYSPTDSDYGYGLKISVIDFIKNELIIQLGDTLKREYINRSKYNYIGLTPFFKYKFLRLKSKLFRGLYTYGGINFEIPIKAQAKHTIAFYNPVRIEETNTLVFEKQLFRFGLQLGIGWDIFDSNIEKKGRTIVTPYLSVNIGSGTLKDFGTKQNVINLKAGFSLKIGIDERHYDTLKYVAKPEPVLTIPIIEPSVLDAQELILTQIEAKEIEPIYIPEEKENIAPALEPALPTNAIGSVTPSSKRVVEFEKKYIINFPKSETDVELTSAGKEFINSISEFMTVNPNSIVIIEGFSDDQGNSKEIQRLSSLRADNVKSIIIQKGITLTRIISVGKGSTKPVTSNSTPEGRARNRRVEIILINK